MRQTIRFVELRKRLIELRRRMLPKKFSPTGDYSERQKDHARGYRLLVHAEIESYIEDIAKEVILNAIRKWDDSGKPSQTIIAFLACYHSSWNPDDIETQSEVIKLAKNRKCMGDCVKDIISAAVGQYMDQLKKNNGIKKKDLQRILVPTGVDLTTVDQTWLTNLDNFGEARGIVAHKTARANIDIDPKSEHDSIKELMSGLKDLDVVLNRLMT
jgi:hypothetical protein